MSVITFAKCLLNICFVHFFFNASILEPFSFDYFGGTVVCGYECVGRKLIFVILKIEVSGTLATFEIISFRLLENRGCC